VPAIISYPAKLPKGEVRDQIITAMDWCPTVLALCNVKRDPNAPKFDGHNILPIIKSSEAKSQYGGVLHFGWCGYWMVRDGDWKLMGTKLRNLADEKPEVKNYADERPEIVARLKAMHEAWVKEVTP